MAAVCRKWVAEIAYAIRVAINAFNSVASSETTQSQTYNH
jgi:hypothetical protein